MINCQEVIVFNPEHINPKVLDVFTLPTVPLGDLRMLPARPGIYFVLNELSEIIYIGQSNALCRRVDAERHEKLQGLPLVDIRIAYLCLPQATRWQLNGIERVFIKRFQPSLNVTWKGCSKKARLAPIKDEKPGQVKSNSLNNSTLTEGQTGNSTCTIYIKLKELRESKGMTQQQLAVALGMSVSSVQKIEGQQNKSMPWDTLEKICTLLDCTPGELLVKEVGAKKAVEELTENQAPILPPKLLSLLPLPASIEAVEEKMVVKVPLLAQRVEELKQKSRSPEEEEELGAYLELMNIVSLLVL